MKPIIAQGMLILYSFTTVLLIPADTTFVVAFLIAVIYIGVSSMGIPEKLRSIMPFLFLLVGYFFPQLLIFTPAVLYSALEKKKYMAGMLLGAMCAFCYLRKEMGVFVLIVFGCAFASLLLYQTKQYEQLAEQFKKTRDDSTELNLLLKEKNRNLLKNQDYEIYTATLKERNRIAREIHDNVGHMLSRAILMVGAMKAVDKEETMKEPMCQLEETLHTAMTNVRESVHDLHDDSVDLKEVLTGLSQSYTFCPVNLIYDMGNFIPREVKYSFIAIVKEALNNIARHSDADKAEIMVREHPGLYQLRIEDNGKGLESIENTEGKGIGIQNMRDRVSAMGGMMQITGEQGFRIYITVPKKEDD